MHTQHSIILGNSQQMPELADGRVQLMVASPPYPMIQMWDELFAKADPKIAELWQKLKAGGQESTVGEIYTAMHENLAKVWQETYRVLVDGMHKHRRRNKNRKRQIPTLPQPLPNNRALRKNRLHHTPIHPMEKTRNQTNVQRKRRLFGLRVFAAECLCYA
jgi:hypothetical protein